MRKLSIKEITDVNGGGVATTAVIIILSGLSGTVVGGGSGIYIASQISVTYAVLPVVIAGSIGVGASIGMLVGVTLGVSGICLSQIHNSKI